MHDLPGETAPPSSGARAIRYAGPIALGLVVASFLVLQAWSLLPHAVDEGIYFYGASRIAGGKLPYRDFFFAHPPLHLLPNALLFALFGYAAATAKLATVFGGAAQGIAAYLLVLRAGNQLQVGRPVATTAGLVATAALLGSETLLRASANDTGISQASAWIAGGAVALAFGRPALAGVLAGAGTCTLLQTGPVAGALAAAAFWVGGRRAGVRFLLGAVAAVGTVHLAFAALAGRAFFEQVYLYHLAKADRPGEGARQLGFVLADNWTLFTGAAMGTVALAAAGAQPRRWAAIGATAIVLQLAMMATRPRVFPFYFLPALFPAAMLLGAGALVTLRALVERSSATRPTFRLALALAAVAVACATVLRWPIVSIVSPTRAEQHARYAQTYSWVDAPGIGPLNAVVRALLWQGGERRAGTDPNAATQFLWQRTRWLDTLPAIVARVRELAAERPGTSLFGDSSIAPLVAVEAGVPIAADVVDTNVERVRTGTLPLDEVLALLDTSPDTLVLAGPRDGIGGHPQVRERLATAYTPVGEFTSRIGQRHTLWARRR